MLHAVVLVTKGTWPGVSGAWGLEDTVGRYQRRSGRRLSLAGQGRAWRTQSWGGWAVCSSQGISKGASTQHIKGTPRADTQPNAASCCPQPCVSSPSTGSSSLAGPLPAWNQPFVS